jgi:uncharacterized protein YecT (DUF1311 family)
MVGAGAAFALGLVLGVWARPNLGTHPDPAPAAQRAATSAPIELNRPAPPPVAATGKLEVLSPDVAAANRGPARSPSTFAQDFGLAPPPPLPAVAEAHAEAPPRVAALTRPMPPAAPQVLDCGGANGLAEQMVCSDPALAAADQEMSRAYGRALRAGGSPDALRADQRDWLAIREDAAHVSRRALAQVYQQRIDELSAAAEGY